MVRKSAQGGMANGAFFLKEGGLAKMSPKSVMVMSLGFVAVIIVLHLLSKLRIK